MDARGEASESARGRRMYALLILAFALFGASTTMYEVNLANYLSDRYQMGAWFRSFLEFPRESQGFAVVFYALLLGGMTEARLFVLSTLAMTVGLAWLALITPHALADGPAGILPGLPMILLIMLHSAGFHLGGTMERCIILDRGAVSQAGARLGRVGFWSTLASLGAAGFVWCLRSVAGVEYETFLLVASSLAGLSMLSMIVAMRGVPGIRPKRLRLVVRKKFARYYALCALFGVRKQVFITFAIWVLVKIYEQPLEHIAILWTVTHVTNLFAQPWIGRLIDRFGPRRVLTVDAVLLVAVCVMYGYSERLFPPGVALVVVSLFYILDHILFFAGSARAVYASSVSDDADETAATLSLGITIDHIFSMSVPFVGGLIWVNLGYELVFVFTGGIALLSALVAFGVPDLKLRRGEIGAAA